MPHEEPQYPKDWLRVAEKDLGRVSSLLAISDPQAAGFFLQQAVEKFLKAFLLSKGWILQRTHDLEALLNHGLAYLPSLETYRAACQKISGFYVVDRYPPFTEVGLTEEDVRTSLNQAEGLIAALRGAMAPE